MTSPRSGIFISYSHQDVKALDQLGPFLRPLERRGLVDFWDDSRLEGGDDWAAEIDRALAMAAAAVLLVSQHFLASDFITDRELPPLLAAAHAGELTVIPVFLSPSLADELDFAFRDAEGTEHRTKLTRFQGYGKPERPLSELSWSDRERVYAKLAKRLSTLCGEPPASAPRRWEPPVRQTVTREPAKLYVLTVRLERRGSELHTESSLPGHEPLADAAVSGYDLGRLDALGAALDQGHLPADAGDLLFAALFGTEEQWGPVLRALFGRPEPAPRPNPPWRPVRLRVATEDPTLLGLPWRLTTWNGRLLVHDGWTFTTTHVVDPQDDYATTAPTGVLIAAPGGGDHPGALVDLLKKVWPTGKEAGYVRAVATRGELVNALAGMRPHVLYVYGEADAPAVADLPAAFREAGHRPDVVWLNTRGAAVPLPAEVPVVVRRRLREHTDDASTRALAWFRRWLGEGDDPVTALHEVTRDDVTTSPEAATLAVHSDYRTWKTTTYQAVRHERRPHLRLDRDQQKALVAKHVAELARSDTRRVMALVAYAAAGNVVHTLAEQLRDHLDLAADAAAEIDWIRLELPFARSSLRRDLEHELRLQLQADDNEPVPHLLRRYAPTVVGSGKRALVWLDWGTFGDGHQEPLKTADLQDWLRFSSEFLGLHCPDDLRLVSYLAIETPAAKHKRLAEVLQAHRRQPWCRRPEFRLSVLPPLGKVAEEDLFDFLEDRQNSTCDPAIHAEVAARLIAETGGEFEPTVALMREAEEGSWYDLLTKLRRSQGEGPSVEDDEPL